MVLNWPCSNFRFSFFGFSSLSGLASMRPRTVFILFKMTFLTLKFALIQTRSSPLKFLRLTLENAPFFSHFFCFFYFSTGNASLFLKNPKPLGGPASGSSKITAFSYTQPSEPFLDLLTPASFARKTRVLSQKCDACGILDLSTVT